MTIDKTDEWNIGRRGEIILYHHLLQNGFTAFDVSGSGGRRAPLFNNSTGNLIAADALMVRSYPVLTEFKTKRRFFDWRGGSQEIAEAGGMPPGNAHGINLNAYHAYRESQKKLKMPLILWFLCIETGEVHAQSLKRLGQPYPSVQEVRGDVMVNWPITKMVPMWTYDPKSLHSYFYLGNAVRPAPKFMPRAEQVGEWFTRLKPVQLEFTTFLEDLIAHLEREWAA